MRTWERQPNFRLRRGLDDQPYQEIRVMNPSRGLNVLVTDMLINDKEGSVVENIEFIEGGAITKRRGYTSTTSGITNPLKGLSVFVNATDNYPMTTDGGVLKKYVGGVATAVTGSVTLDVNANINLTPIGKQYMYGWDGVSGGVVYDGTTVSRPGTIPKGKYSVPYKSWHVVSGVDGQDARVYFARSSEPSRFTDAIVPADPNDVALNNVANVPGATVFAGTAGPKAIDINKNDGEAVTGLGFFQDVLIVFKERSIFQLYFNSDGGFVVERISSSYGCVSHNSIASVENDCYFLSSKGVMVLGNEPNYYAAIRTNELSSRIKTIIESIDPANWEKCKAIYYDDRYWLTVPIGSDGVNYIIVYDKRFYAWALWSNIHASDMAIFYDDDNVEHFYFADGESPKMNEFVKGTYNDDGEPIEAIFRSRAFEAKVLDREKYWYVLRPVFRNVFGTINIKYITENGEEGEPLTISPTVQGGLGYDMFGSLMFGTSMTEDFSDSDLGISDDTTTTSNFGNNSNPVFQLPIELVSRTFAFEVSNSVVNENFALLGWIILFQERDQAVIDGAYVIR